ncbi:hypothetical protein [Ureibacillus manganicus]|uniref:Uncharacterized protein n=1 Tax=Ureibacillus manganicus DSM 26584 TaxID=1384049 RepID=A0A0A3INK1_9BACL|nr:hypothetical protein [Ureibacillus manganicus]KGR76417.1 hypothetical protein CD29_16985 [Ureibacillus manganicus DSM 26584]
MGNLSELANVSLINLLSNYLNERLGLTIKIEWNEKLQGRVHELYYVEFNKYITTPEQLQQLIQVWKPIYEQLSLFNDYLALRLQMTTNNSYNVVEQLEELMKDVHTPRLELWMDAKSRAELINQLDDSAFVKNIISKKQLHYLAVNTSSVQELYELIQHKITPFKFVKNTTSEKLQLQLKESFQTLHRALQHMKKNRKLRFCIV